MTTAFDIAKLARNLCGQIADETRIRCAVGRSYYAAFHFCQGAAEAWCTPLTSDEKRDAGSHDQLYARLQGHSKVSKIDESLRLMAEQAKKLRVLRVTADYHLDKSVTSVDLQRGLVYMQQVQTLAESLTKEAAT